MERVSCSVNKIGQIFFSFISNSLLVVVRNQQISGEASTVLDEFDEKYFYYSSISLWGVLKKKPLVTVKNAHVCGEGKQNWITAVTALQNTDLVASGENCV